MKSFARRFLFVLLLALLAGAALVVLARSWLAGWAASDYLAGQGVAARIHVSELDTRHLTARFSLGPQAAPDAEGVLTAHFTGRRIDAVEVTGGVLRMGYDGRKLLLGAIQTLLDKFKPSQTGNSQFLAPGWRFAAPDLRLHVAMPQGTLEARGTVTARDGALERAQLAFTLTRFAVNGYAVTLRGGALRAAGKDKRIAATLTAAADITGTGLALQSLHVQAQAADIATIDGVDAPSLTVTAALDRAILKDGAISQVNLSFHGAARAGKDVAITGALALSAAPDAAFARAAADYIPFWGADARNRAALAANAARLTLDAPCLSLTLGDSVTLALPQAAIITGASGARLAWTGTAHAESGNADMAGHLQLSGGGLPALTLDTPGLTWRDSDLSGDVALKTRLDAQMLRGLSLDAQTHIAWHGGTLAVTLARCAALRLDSYRSSGKAMVRNIAATVCGSGPLLSADAKGWRFDGRAAGLSLLLPQAVARIDQSAAQAAIRGDGHGMTAGHVTVTASRLTDMTAPVRFHPLNGAATADLAHGVWQGDAALTNKGHALAHIRFRHALADGTGQALIDTPALSFATGQLQPVDVSPLLALVAQAQGAARFTGHLDWTAKTVTSGGRLDVEDLSFMTPLGMATGFSTHIDFTSLNPLVTRQAEAGAARVEWLSPLTGTDVRFALSDTQLALDNVVTHVTGGTVRLDPLRLTLSAAPKLEGILHLENIDLGQLVAGSNLAERVKLDAHIDGTVPFTLSDGALRIHDGRIAAIRPGRISIARTLWTDAPAAANAVQDFAYQALENLAFDTLDGSLNSLPEGRLGLLLHLKGRNDPAQGGVPEIPLTALIQGGAFDKPLPLPKGTPIDLTLDTTLNFDELLRSYNSAWMSALSAQQ